MSDLFEVPGRVRAGSTSPVSSIDAWRATWLATRDDPSGFWLAETKRRVAWREEPGLGLQGTSGACATSRCAGSPTAR